MGHDLRGKVQKPATQGGRKRGGGYHGRADILLESFEQEKGCDHGIVDGGIRGEAFEREFFEAEVLEGSVNELVFTSIMIGMNDCLGLGHVQKARGLEELVHGTTHAQICVDECPRPTAWQEKLLFF